MLINLLNDVFLFKAKGKERQWLKNQTYGDLDEAKLIEGITGERSIYRRRGEQDPEVGYIVQAILQLKFQTYC